MKNLFQAMFEEDPPQVDDLSDQPMSDQSSAENPSNEVPTSDMPMDSSPPPVDDYPDDQPNDGYQDDNSQQNPPEQDDTSLDEKGEIFAKVKALKQFRSIYSKIEDTLSLIDKIDLVQVGNHISSDDISEIKSEFSDLMNDVYTTIVYEFQLQYKILKTKLIKYSAQYVLLSKKLVNLIKKDQHD